MIDDDYSGEGTRTVIAGCAVVVSLLVHFLVGAFFADREFHIIKTDIPECRFTSVAMTDVQPQLQSVENEAKMMADADVPGFEPLPPGLPETVFDPPPVPDAYGLPSGNASEDTTAGRPEIKDAQFFVPRVTMLTADSVTAPTLEYQTYKIPDAERTANAPDIVPAVFKLNPTGGESFSENTAFAPTTLPRGMSEADKEASKEPEYEEEMTALSPPEITEEEENPLKMAVEDPTDKIEPIENVLNTELSVYRPAVPDGYKYFKIDISRRSEESLDVIPRDVLFVLDTSSSVSWMRMGIVRKAVRKAIESLGACDRFNILSFSSQTRFCFGNVWQTIGNASKEVAADFLDSLEAEGNTDIYGAMKCVLDLPREPGRVMLVFLISDGRPTAGLQKVSKIISEFSALNSGRVSVFASALGSSDNEYLLSMLSVLNRGDLAVVPDSKFRIASGITDLVKSTSRAVLSDISFTFDSDSAADIAPAMTTHLFLDRPLSVFGRVEEAVDRVIFQARGVSGKKRYDMVFSLNLENPGVRKGSPLVATDWAKARMYDYFAVFDKTHNPEMVDKMLELRSRYGVIIPFVKLPR